MDECDGEAEARTDNAQVTYPLSIVRFEELVAEHWHDELDELSHLTDRERKVVRNVFRDYVRRSRGEEKIAGVPAELFRPEEHPYLKLFSSYRDGVLPGYLLSVGRIHVQGKCKKTVPDINTVGRYVLYHTVFLLYYGNIDLNVGTGSAVSEVESRLSEFLESYLRKVALTHARKFCRYMFIGVPAYCLAPITPEVLEAAVTAALGAAPAVERYRDYLDFAIASKRTRPELTLLFNGVEFTTGFSVPEFVMEGLGYRGEDGICISGGVEAAFVYVGKLEQDAGQAVDVSSEQLDTDHSKRSEELEKEDNGQVPVTADLEGNVEEKKGTVAVSLQEHVDEDSDVDSHERYEYYYVENPYGEEGRTSFEELSSSEDCDDDIFDVGAILLIRSDTLAEEKDLYRSRNRMFSPRVRRPCLFLKDADDNPDYDRSADVRIERGGGQYRFAMADIFVDIGALSKVGSVLGKVGGAAAAAGNALGESGGLVGRVAGGALGLAGGAVGKVGGAVGLAGDAVEKVGGVFGLERRPSDGNVIDSTLEKVGDVLDVAGGALGLASGALGAVGSAADKVGGALGAVAGGPVGAFAGNVVGKVAGSAIGMASGALGSAAAAAGAAGGALGSPGGVGSVLGAASTAAGTAGGALGLAGSAVDTIGDVIESVSGAVSTVGGAMGSAGDTVSKVGDSLSESFGALGKITGSVVGAAGSALGAAGGVVDKVGGAVGLAGGVVDAAGGVIGSAGDSLTVAADSLNSAKGVVVTAGGVVGAVSCALGKVGSALGAVVPSDGVVGKMGGAIGAVAGGLVGKVVGETVGIQEGATAGSSLGETTGSMVGAVAGGLVGAAAGGALGIASAVAGKVAGGALGIAGGALGLAGSAVGAVAGGALSAAGGALGLAGSALGLRSRANEQLAVSAEDDQKAVFVAERDKEEVGRPKLAAATLSEHDVAEKKWFLYMKLRGLFNDLSESYYSSSSCCEKVSRKLGLLYHTYDMIRVYVLKLPVKLDAQSVYAPE
ncbi:A type inclusion protein [Eastern grey kangaroopox virus]|uniref:A-type inclusion protein n=1 Tax=Eastern grey kangaroopox virus TaxID=2042482 RepID=A0A2C9DT94_9POXV|nr:A type inclusion protein [Eastern grey kangaroopox virus]ATI21227.1 A type inclusion protein [Eastern grey kangaroopox virus]ATX75134.1 A-type inclusion protein [Eastern grey kangaroopox virus]